MYDVSNGSLVEQETWGVPNDRNKDLSNEFCDIVDGFLAEKKVVKVDVPSIISLVNKDTDWVEKLLLSAERLTNYIEEQASKSLKISVLKDIYERMKINLAAGKVSTDISKVEELWDSENIFIIFSTLVQNYTGVIVQLGSYDFFLYHILNFCDVTARRDSFCPHETIDRVLHVNRNCVLTVDIVHSLNDEPYKQQLISLLQHDILSDISADVLEM